MSKRHRLAGYLAFHSFGNKILYPWGYTKQPTNDVQDLRGFAKVAKNAISNSFAQKRSFGDFLFSSEPALERYTVGQGSLREAPTKKKKKKKKQPTSVRNSLRRIIFGDFDDAAAQTEGEYEFGQPQVSCDWLV